MTCHLYLRIDCYRLGAATMTITESGGKSAVISFPATTGYRLYHGDATHNTGDGILPTDGGTIVVGTRLPYLLNNAGLDYTYAVAWDPATGKYAITWTGGGTAALTFSTHGEAGERMRRILGMNGDHATAASQSSDQACRFWLTFPGGRSNDGDRQPLEGFVHGSAVASGRGQAAGIGPANIPYGRRWEQHFVPKESVYNRYDATGGDVETLERAFELLRDGERFLWFDSGTTTFSYANRGGVYQLSEQGISGWRTPKRDIKTTLYWIAIFDTIELADADPAAAEPVLLDLVSAGTFSRGSSTSATYRTSDATVGHAAADELRLEDVGDGWGPQPLYEGERTNVDPRSESMDSGSYWTAQNLSSRTDHYAVCPDGTVEADRLVSDGVGGGTNNRVYITTTHAGSVAFTASCWYRDDSQNTGDHAHSIGHSHGGGYDYVDAPKSLSWRRAAKTIASVSANGAPFIHVNAGGTAGSPAASGDDLLVWGQQAEVGGWASSYIVSDSGSATTRPADTHTFSTAETPGQMLSGRWQAYVSPQMASSELVSGDILVLYGFDSANHSIRIRHDGTGVRVEAYQGGAVKAYSDYLTWSADQWLTITLDSVAATVAVTGATTGNGVGATGTAWTMPSAAGMRAGGNYGGTAELFGRLAPPRSA